MYQMISKLKEPSKIPSSTLSLPYSERVPRIVFQKPGEKTLTELRGTEKKRWFRDQAQLIRSSVHWNAKGDDVSAQGEENQFVTDWITSFCPRSTMPLPIDFMGSSDQSILCHHQLESQGRKEEKGNLYDCSNCAVWDTSLEAIHSAGFFGSWSRWANAGEKFRILARIHSFTHHHISMYLSPLRLYHTLDGLQIEIYFWVSE